MGSKDIVGGAAQKFGSKAKEKMEVDATPVKKACARPPMEHMPGRSRLKPMYEDDEGSPFLPSDIRVSELFLCSFFF